jgi:8-oxo-dGTP diphosphatase
MPQHLVDVAAAVIERADGTFLLQQRPNGKIYAGYWEFPGGKVNRGEPITGALHRELSEELGIEVELAYRWITRVFAYEHATVRLHFFRVVRWRGDPKPNEKQLLSWQPKDGPLTVSPMLPANVPVLKSLSLPLSLGITCATELGIDVALEALQRAILRGLRLVQVRDKNLSRPVRAEFATQVAQAMQVIGGITMINDDPQLAAALNAGLHLTSNQLMSIGMRPDFEWCSASCHNVLELVKAAHLGLDFVLLGPVHRTPTHQELGGLGWDQFTDLIRDYPIPVFALGGVQMANLDESRRMGAHGVAMLRGAWDLRRC